jgi:hypothetical protein
VLLGHLAHDREPERPLERTPYPGSSSTTSTRVMTDDHDRGRIRVDEDLYPGLTGRR